MASSLSTLCSVTDFTRKASIDDILAEINADNSSILSSLMKELSKEVVVVEEASTSDLMLKEVRSDDEGYEMYNEYAFRKGFSIHMGLIRTSHRTGLWIMRRFVCSNAGFKDVKKETSRNFFITKDGVWIVVRHNMIHNHLMIPADKRYLLRSQRDITEEQLKYFSAMKASGCRVFDLLRAMRKRYFSQRQASESDFYYDFELDEHGSLISFFWRDGGMKRDYEYFGDLLVFDTTYRTNRYDIICAPFVGMNHHSNNVVFGLGSWLMSVFLPLFGCLSLFCDQWVAEYPKL
ncbi:protein FAR1-RELATED SEQUENCE 5 [Spinacia oleracea]|uniref:Protein FAR1-RELATED SEQUENCE 5 n=1 Tax=Spinacia oleracea TaxID=3562 RepID=A0ABM3RIW5_SPIOL|nr:protein FAR1-RELATED SEQUENCE 5-like [Spinacia oleracea]